MINMIKAEHLKYKRTFSQIFSFIMPLYILVSSIAMNIYFFTNSINWLTIAFMPFSISIFCILASIREKKFGRYRTIKSKDLNFKELWFSKIIVIGYYTFITSVMIIVNFFIVKVIFDVQLIDLKGAFIGVMVIWFTTLVLIPISLFTSEKFGTFVSVVVTCIGCVLGIIMSIGKYWYICPWSICSRLMCPILKINPNGMILEQGSPLLDSSVISTGFISSIIGLIFLSVITSIWFDKKEAN